MPTTPKGHLRLPTASSSSMLPEPTSIPYLPYLSLNSPSNRYLRPSDLASFLQAPEKCFLHTPRPRGSPVKSIRSPGARASMPAHTIFAPILLPPPIYLALIGCDFISKDMAGLVYLVTIQPFIGNTIKMRMVISRVPRHATSCRDEAPVVWNTGRAEPRNIPIPRTNK
jgi:hypothetical protein